MSKTAALCALLVCGAVTAPSSANAQSIIKQPFGGRRPMQLDFHAGFTYIGAGLATGARFGIPILHNGFIKKLNNAVYINFGVDFYFAKYKGKSKDGYAPALGIPVTLHWEFYFTPKWSAFGEVGPNIYIHPELFRGDGFKFSGAHWVAGGVGGRYWISQRFTLTLRVGNPYSSFGVSLMF